MWKVGPIIGKFTTTPALAKVQKQILSATTIDIAYENIGCIIDFICMFMQEYQVCGSAINKNRKRIH